MGAGMLKRGQASAGVLFYSPVLGKERRWSGRWLQAPPKPRLLLLCLHHNPPPPSSAALTPGAGPVPPPVPPPFPDTPSPPWPLTFLQTQLLHVHPRGHSWLHSGGSDSGRGGICRRGDRIWVLDPPGLLHHHHPSEGSGGEPAPTP